MNILISDFLLSRVIEEYLGEDSLGRVEESASQLMRQETCVVISHNSNEGRDMVGQVPCLDYHIGAACLQEDVSQHQRRAGERLL